MYVFESNFTRYICNFYFGNLFQLILDRDSLTFQINTLLNYFPINWLNFF